MQVYADEMSHEPAERLLSDEEVIASQRFFSVQWRKRYNAGDVLYCSKAYLEDAVLHVSFGPLAKTVHHSLHLPNPALLHGRVAIEAFWNASRIALGFEEMRAYEEDGKYASSAIAVDDDTVLVHSPFSVSTEDGGFVHGQIHSEMWVRLGQKWKLRSTVIAIEEVESRRTRSSEKVQTDGPTEVPKSRSSKTRETKSTAKVAKTTTAPEASKDSEVEEGIDSADREAAEISASGTDDNAAEQHSGGHTFIIITTVVLLTCGVAAIFVRRAKNRRDATIAGFEAMLG